MFRMLKTCSRCGRIHSRSGCKAQRIKKKYSNNDKFRSSYAWQKVREEIRERDNHLCQLCIRNLHNTTRTYTYDDLSVHHIIPIEEANERSTDYENLILLCRHHHEKAEAGEIDRKELLQIAKAQQHPPV